MAGDGAILNLCGSFSNGNGVDDLVLLAVTGCAPNRVQGAEDQKPFALVQEGWKVRNYPAGGEVFFLTFPFIELTKTWPRTSQWATIQTQSARICPKQSALHRKVTRSMVSRLPNSS